MGVGWTPLPNPCMVKIKNGTQSKRCEMFLKYIVYLPKVLLKFSKKDIIIIEKKVEYQIWKSFSQKKQPRKNLPKTWVYLNHLIFWRSYRSCKNCISPWKSMWMDIFDWVWRNIFLLFFFSGVIFSQAKEKIHRKKNPQKLSQWKFKLSQERNTRPEERWKIMQNVDSPRVTPKSAKLTWYPILKTQS